jgi:quercetin dioxygenase-like cupin family protein
MRPTILACPLVLAMLLFVVVSAGTVAEQLPGTKVLGGCDVPASRRTSETGCYLTATHDIGQLSADDAFWHVYTYPSRAEADQVKHPASGTVVESLGKVWRFTIANERWQPASGTRMTVIGPLPIVPAKKYTARYMEAVFPANQSMQTAVHVHSGPEAWYVVNGAQCLRTPDRTMVIRAGEGGFVEAGPPMLLTSIGSEIRRAIVLVLHDVSEPWMTIATEWTPKSSCPAQ